MKKHSYPHYLRVALALEPRMMFDAAAVTTAVAVADAQTTSDAPAVVAKAVADNVYTIDENGVVGADVPLFSSAEVSEDTHGEALTRLVVTVNTSGNNQALVIDGSDITLTTTANSATKNNNYTYNVTVADGQATITLYLDAADTVTSDKVETLIVGMRYQALDSDVDSGDVTVTLASVTDEGGQRTDLGISATVTIDNEINTAPELTTDSGPIEAQVITTSDLDAASEVAYSTDGAYAYVASQDGTLVAYAVGDNGILSEIQSLSGISDLSSVTDMVVGEHALYAITGGSIVTVTLGADGSLGDSSIHSIGDNGISISMSSDGTMLFVGSQYNGLYVYSVDGDNGTLSDLTRLTDNVTRSAVAAMSGDYLFVIAPGMTQTLAVYSRSGTTLTRVTELSIDTWDWTTSYAHLAVSADNSMVYVANATSGSISAYRFQDNTLTALDSENLSGVSAIALSDDGTLLYATSTDGTLASYIVGDDGTLTLSTTVAGAGGVALAVSDGSILTVGDGTLVNYNYLRTYTVGGDPVAVLAGLTLSDSNNDALASGVGNYNGASITISASDAGGTFSFTAGDGLSYANGIISLNGAAIARFTTAADGSLSVSFTAEVTTAVTNQLLHQITYANDNATPGSLIQFSVTGSDGALDSNTLAVTLRVNTTPTVNTDASTGYQLDSATSETDYNFTLFPGLFSDADGDVLTWSVSGLPDGITFDASSRTLSGSTSATGTFTLTITATDASGGSTSLTLDLVVEQVANRAPVITDGASTTLTSATQDSHYQVTLDSSLFSDADARYGDTLTWSISGLPEGISFDASTLTLSGVTLAVGSYTVSVTVTDEQGASARTDLALRVITAAEASNSAPDISSNASALIYTSDGALSGYSYYVNSITLSDDGSSLIIAGSTSNNGNGTSYLSVYHRDIRSGELTLLQTFTQGTTDDGDASNGIEVDGLSGITSISFSADGSKLYLAGYTATGSSSNYTLSVFSIDAASGALSLSGQFSGPGEKVLQIGVADDGDTLYALSATSVYAYTLNDDGAISLLASYSDNYSTAVALQIDDEGTVYVLSGARLTVYTATDNGSLTLAGQLTRSGTTLTWTDGAGNASEAGILDNANAFNGARSFAVSAAGDIYLVTTNGFLTTLNYDNGSNTLSVLSTLDAYNVLSQYPHGITLSEDGSALYVVGGASSKLAVYAVGSDGVPVLANVISTSGGSTNIVVSPDGQSIYAGPSLYFAPGLRVISASGAVSVAYNEGGTIQPGAQLTLADADYDALAEGAGNYNGATLTLVRDGGADNADSYGFANGNGLTLNAGTLYLDGTAIGTFSSVAGALSITFSAEITTAVANQVLQQITYTNASSNLDSTITLVLTVGDEYTTSQTNLLLTISRINDAPTLETVSQDVVYTTGGSAVKLFSDSVVSTVEDDQLISNVTLTVSGLSDGANETLEIGGIALTLSDGAGFSSSLSEDVQDSDGNTTTYSYSYSIAVSVTDGVATVTLSSSGLPAASVAALINRIAYANSSENPTTGVRTLTLTTLQDNGGTDNGGVDTSPLAITATITVNPANTAPSATASGAQTDYSENGEAAGLFSDVSLSTGEQGQSIIGITFTVSGLHDGEHETLSLDDTAIALVAGSGTTASGYNYTITTEGDVVTLSLSNSDGVTVTEANALLGAMTYANTSDDPSAGNRTVTLSAIQDNGGTASQGSDTATLAIAATITVVTVNDAPVVNTTVSDNVYAESGSSSSLFSDTAMSTVENGQTITALTLSVAGLVDGSSETLVVDGATLVLTTGTGTTDSGYSWQVTLDAASGVATVTLTLGSGLPVAEAAALVDTIAYVNLNTAFTAGARTITLNVQDSGGVANGGSDTSSATASATVTLVENSAPVLGSTPDNEALSVIESLSTVSGLADIAATTLTADGSFLYAIASDGALAVFSRNASTGELVYLQTLTSGVSDATEIQLDDDASHLYVLGSGGDALSIFSCSTADGSLTLAQTLVTENVVDFTVADDGALYVVDGNYSGLRVYSQQGDSGQYTLTQAIDASVTSEPYLFTGVGIAVAGDTVFVITDPAASTAADTVIVYQRNSDGTLSPVTWLRDGATDSDGTTLAMTSPSDIVVSADGKSVYIATADSVTILNFAADSGTLTIAGQIAGLTQITDIALSDDGDVLYLMTDGTLSRYDVSGGTPVLLSQFTSEDYSDLTDAQSISVGDNGAVIVASTSGLVNLQDSLNATISLDYNEQGTILIADALTLADADYDAFSDGDGNYNGATLTVSRSDGARVDDHFGFVDGNSLTRVDNSIMLDGVVIARFTEVDGTLTITFTADVSSVNANRVLQQITYTNSSTDPGSNLALTLSVSDAYTSDSVTLVLAVTTVNNAPTLSSSGISTDYAEGGSGVNLFSGTITDTVEAGQTITDLTLTVSGLSDNAQETLTIDGSQIALVNGSGTTDHGYVYTVTLDGDTATVILSSDEGMATTTVTSLVDAMTYSNGSDDPHAGTRTITLARISDNGGSAANGVASSELNISATVAVMAVNDAPVVNVSAHDSDYRGSAVNLFSDTEISTVEADDRIVALTLSVTGLVDGGSEILTIDGSAVALSAGNAVTTASGYLVSVSLDSYGAATVTIAASDGVTAAQAATLIDGISYQNATASGGNRLITLSGVQDSGGTHHGGSDTARLAVTATVSLNHAPQAVAGADTLPAATANQNYSQTLPQTLFTDADGDTLVWQVSGLPEGLSFDAATRTIAGIPTAVGSVVLSIVVQDGQGGEASRTLTLDINPLTVPASDVNPVILPAHAQFTALSSGQRSLMTADPFFDSRPPLTGLDALSVIAEGASPLSSGPLDYTLAPWTLDPIMTSLMPALEPVAFSHPHGRHGISESVVDMGWEGHWQRTNHGQWQYSIPPRLLSQDGLTAFASVRLANGRPLPDWLQFDARHGVLRVTGVNAPRTGQIQLLFSAADGTHRRVLTLKGELTATSTADSRDHGVRVAPMRAAPERAPENHQTPAPVAQSNRAFSHALTAADDAQNALLQAVQTLVMDAGKTTGIKQKS